MVNPSHRETALYFCVDDLPGASIPSARLQGILELLRQGKRVTEMSLGFLEQQGLAALHRLATGALPYDRFRESALAEQVARIEAEAAARQVREAEGRAHAAAMLEAADLHFKRLEAARVARESDPKYIAKMRGRELRAKYGIDTFVEQAYFDRLMTILKGVDAGRRMCAEDYTWLSTAAKSYFSEELKAAYHRLEADFFISEYKRTRDPWKAINASSQLRKCSDAPEAEALLSAVDTALLKSAKLRSAFDTTRGGVMRDLRRWQDALRLGESAHSLAPNDFRPCTLLGAIHMELDRFDVGQAWYAKAVDRGATVDSVDQDLRSVFFRADRDKQAALSAFLLADDPVRYAWARKAPQFPKRGLDSL